MRKTLTVLGAAGLLLLAGCSTGVAQSDVEEMIADELEQQIGARPNIACPDDLEGEVGAEMTCVLSADGPEEFEVYLSVTGVDGDEVYFDMQVAEQPMG